MTSPGFAESSRTCRAEMVSTVVGFGVPPVARSRRKPMSMAACYLAPAIVLTLTLHAAQPANQPDFSGHWQLMRGTGLADAALDLEVVQVVTRTTIYGAPMDPYYSDIKITRGTPTSTLVETHKIGIVGGMVNGTAAGASARDPRRTEYSVRWDGNRLRFLNRIYEVQPSG